MVAAVRWLARAIVVVGAGTLPLTVGSQAALTPVDAPILSPDRAFKAVVTLDERGGVISPHCYTSVGVVPAAASMKDARADAAMVFGSACDSFSLDPKCNCIEPSPKVEWIAADELRITFSIHSTALVAHTVKLRKIDASGSVHIRFVVAE